ncbi:MAG: hypothetical protein GWP19_04680 [Planctomycetia bacterium]|nr:hypothetical protein [Planctomycetia bacterium]
MEYFDLVYNEINKAILNPEDSDSRLSGYSGNKLLSVLQNLSRSTLDVNTCYLEVGVYQGLSLLSVAKEINNSIAYGIDNFAFFDKDGKNLSIIRERINKLNVLNAEILNSDYEDVLENLSLYIGDKKIGVYFVDGPHDYRSQLMCLLLIKPFLSENAVIIIDDSNYSHVRQANKDFLQTNPEFKLFFEAYTSSHPNNMMTTDKELARKGWWNGVNILVKDKKNLLSIFFPPTMRDRTLYENEHTMHAIKYPLVPIKLLNIYDLIGKYLNKRFRKRDGWYEGRYKLMNTYSETLPEYRFNEKFLIHK